MILSLDGQVAIVTGAGTGLGRAIAEEFEDAGAHVIPVGLTARADRSDWRRIDVRDQSEVDALIQDVVAEHGSLDVIVNNAGVSPVAGSSVDKPLSDWNEMVDTNLTGTWHCCRSAIRQMLTQPGGGRVINISSRLALSAGGPGRAAYAATKAGVSNLTRQLAVEYGRLGVRVNAILPGFVPYTAAVTTNDPERIRLALEQTPGPRLGLPADIAAAALFLASDAAAYVNGHNLVVDGGASVRS